MKRSARSEAALQRQITEAQDRRVRIQAREVRRRERAVLDSVVAEAEALTHAEGAVGPLRVQFVLPRWHHGARFEMRRHPGTFGTVTAVVDTNELVVVLDDFPGREATTTPAEIRPVDPPTRRTS